MQLCIKTTKKEKYTKTLILYTKYVLLPALPLKSSRDARKELLEQLSKGLGWVGKQENKTENELWTERGSE